MEYLTERGFQVLDVKRMGITDDSRIVRISPDEIYRFVKDADIPETDGVLLVVAIFDPPQ